MVKYEVAVSMVIQGYLDYFFLEEGMAMPVVFRVEHVSDSSNQIYRRFPGGSILT